MELRGVYRSSSEVIAYEDHYSGRITELGYAFLLFDGLGGVNRYLAGERDPVEIGHEFWESSQGRIMYLDEDIFQVELLSSMSKQMIRLSVKILTDRIIETTNLESGDIIQYEKVVG